MRLDDNMDNLFNRIHEYSLEDIMGDRFGRYAKQIIQNRAIPDVRDGLKPVQRRILYGMFKTKNTHDKKYEKSAKAVGYIMGHYHPHGDSSIYDAMARMSQWWKSSVMYVDMQGNNGSIDGDSPAAMRYTEARLSKISQELLKDIDKNTISWAPTFDDSDLEPTVLPAKFPNLLVNGATGISAGYATNIPTHNLGEVIDATIKRIDSPNCRLDSILEVMPGPDFPTGGVVEGKNGIKQAFETGKGRIIIRSKIEFEKTSGIDQIVITEIPFEVNKMMMVKKIEDIRIDKKIDGISDVRDESDREGIRVVIDIKKGFDKEIILNYLLKNTDLQVSYNYNMVAIVNKRPKTVGVLGILDAYIAHLKEVIIKRTEFDLEAFKSDMHIAEGLYKAISILDEVIKTIRASKNKMDAKDNLVKEFKFTEKQAEAIVMLQLYRLTNTDIVTLEEKIKNLELLIRSLEALLADEDKIKKTMKLELRKIKEEYAIPRKTVIRDEITEIKLDTLDLVKEEDVIVVITKEGYVKRVSKRSYSASEGETTLKDGDYVIGEYELTTLDNILLFTKEGNYIFLPVHMIPDLKWKELGKHISNVVKITGENNLISSYPVKDFKEDINVTVFTKNGMAKQTKLSDFEVNKYTKPLAYINLNKKDEVISVNVSNKPYVVITTHDSYTITYDKEQIPVSGLKTKGVKAINLKGDYVVGASLFSDNDEYLTIITDKNTGKRVKLTEFPLGNRTNKGILSVRNVKTNPHSVIYMNVLDKNDEIGLRDKEEIEFIKATSIKIMDRESTGSLIRKENIDEIFVKFNYKEEVLEPKEEVIEQVTLEGIDEQILIIEDFLDNIEKDK